MWQLSNYVNLSLDIVAGAAAAGVVVVNIGTTATATETGNNMLPLAMVDDSNNNDGTQR